nr:putative ribonuclease H-like domain-containing protein [Tanacetum cinerariifolium]
DEFIKSSVENLVPNLSESKDLSNSECDVPTCDDFTTFSNLLFDAHDDFSSCDDESFSDEDISKEIYSNPLFDEETISMKIDPHHFNVESDLIESLLNHDSSIISSSSKIDSLLDEFAGKLILLKSILPGIDETDCDPEEEIRLIEKFLHDNSSPRPPKEFISENSDAKIESFSPSPIPFKDSDSLINDSLLLLENESIHFDIPSSHRLPTKPLDDDSRILTVKVTIVANSTTEAEYVAAVNCCRQVLWIQNQMLDYRFNLMNTKIYIDNESTICIMKNLVFHSKTKHIEIRYHFIRDSYEKKLIQVIKIHRGKNVANLLTKAFDVSSAKTTAWNEFSNTMAYAIICLADNQKFNFSKYIFDNMVKSLKGRVKFYLFPRFLQVFLNKQVEGMPRRKQRKEEEVSHDESQDEDHVPKPSSDPLPSGEDSFILNELMVLCTSLKEQVLDLQQEKAAQAKEIVALKKKVSKLNKWRKSRSRGLKRLEKSGSGRMIEEIDQYAEIALDAETQGRTNDDEMFKVDDLVGEEVVKETTTGVKDSAASTTDVTEDEITVAHALAALKSTKPKVVVQEQEMSTTILAATTIVTTDVPTLKAKGIVFHKQNQSQIPTVSSSKDKGKAKMIKPKIPTKRKEQMRIDEEYFRELEAEEQKAARLSRAQKDEEANNFWDNMQAMMDADRLLAERLQAREREELSELWIQKHKKVVQKIAEHLESDISKKQKVDENVEPIIDDFEELKKYMEIVLDDGDEVLIEATPISSRYPTIILYKIHKEGKKNYFKIIRADGLCPTLVDDCQHQRVSCTKQEYSFIPLESLNHFDLICYKMKDDHTMIGGCCVKVRFD